MTINNTKIALVMDLQERLIANIGGKDCLMESNVMWVKICRLLNIQTIITEQVPEKLGPTVPGLLEIGHGAPVISKNSFSAFGNPGFIEELNKSGASHLFLSGVETSICVYLTALDALQGGLKVTILNDCVAGRRVQDSTVALSQLRTLGASVIPLETATYSFLKDAEHREFKSVSALIRERSVS